MLFTKEITMLEEIGKGISAQEGNITDPYEITDIHAAKGGIHIAYTKLLALQKRHRDD